MRNRDEEQKGKRNEKKFGLENNRCAISFSLPLPPSFLPSLPRSRARWHTHTDTQTHDTRRAHLGAKADVEHGVLT